MRDKESRKESFNPLVFLFPLFFYYRENASKLAIRSESWTKIRKSKFRKPVMAIIVSILALISFFITISTLLSKNLFFAITSFIAWNIIQIPLAKLFLFYKMNPVVARCLAEQKNKCVSLIYSLNNFCGK